MYNDYKVLVDGLNSILGSEKIKFNELMSKHTTFKLGGPSDVMIFPSSESELKDSMKEIIKSKVPYFVLGSGSNLLVKDGGIRGVVVNLTKFEDISVEGTKIKAYSGAKLWKISSIACENALSGFAFACGIPGTIGGAINMNAGAYGGEMSQVISKVNVIDTNGESLSIDKKDMEYGYRSTVIMRKKYLIVSCEISLTHGDRDEIHKEIEDLMYRRNSKQPLNYPSAGSTFKRPPGYFAGKLIEDSGLRGYIHKNVMVSEKHCGFIVTRNSSATAKEVLELIDIVKERVYNNFKVNLEMEVRVIGED